MLITGISNLAGRFLFKTGVGDEDPDVEGSFVAILCLKGWVEGEILDVGERDDDPKIDLCYDGENTGDFDITTDIFSIVL